MIFINLAPSASSLNSKAPHYIAISSSTKLNEIISLFSSSATDLLPYVHFFINAEWHICPIYRRDPASAFDFKNVANDMVRILGNGTTVYLNGTATTSYSTLTLFY